MIASAILAFVGAWNEFLFACILSVNKSRDITGCNCRIHYRQWPGMGDQWRRQQSLHLVPVLILVWALQKHFVQGLAMGAVKGTGDTENKDMKRSIVCYGDSNTWGISTITDGRFQDEVRLDGKTTEKLGADGS